MGSYDLILGFESCNFGNELSSSLKRSFLGLENLKVNDGMVIFLEHDRL